MVGKLFRNNFEDSFKLYLPVLITIGICTFLGLIGVIQLTEVLKNVSYIAPDNLIGSVVSLFILVIGIYTIMIMMFISSIRVVYSSIYKKNAYRLFTFPVKMWEIFVSKLLILVFWNIVCGTLMGVGLLLVLGVGTMLSSQFSQIIGYLYQEVAAIINTLGLNNIGYLILYMIRSFFSSLEFAAVVLLAGSITHSSSITKRRGLMTFLLYLGISLVLFILSLLFFSSTGPSFTDIILYGTNSISSATYTEFSITSQIMQIIYSLIILGGSLWATSWMWEHKLEITNE